MTTRESSEKSEAEVATAEAIPSAPSVDAPPSGPASMPEAITSDPASIDPKPPPPSASGVVARRSGIVAVGTLLSRVLGVVRDQVLAASFAPPRTDLFFDAFTIPNALRGLLAEGAVSSALVPSYAAVRGRDGEAAARTFFQRFFGTMLSIVAVVVILGEVFAETLASLYGEGFGERFEPFVVATRIIFPYIALMAIAALHAGVLQAHGRFGIASAAPALLNVALISAPFLITPLVARFGFDDVASLCIAAILGGALHVAVQLPSVRRLGLLGLPRFSPRDPDVRAALALLLPLMVGLGLYQLNVVFARRLAAGLEPGSLSFLYYGQRLVEVPQGMFALAVSSAALPMLAELVSQEKHEEAQRVFRDALQLSLFVAIPLSIWLYAFSEPIVTILLARGAFTVESARETAASLGLQAIGVAAIAAVRVVVPMFYAHRDTRTPLVGSFTNLAVFVGVASWLSPTWGHRGLAVALSAAGVAQALVLFALLAPKIALRPLVPLAGHVVRGTVAAVLAALAGRALVSFAPLERGGNHWPNFVFVGGALALTAVVFAILATLFGAPELARLRAAVRRRVGR